MGSQQFASGLTPIDEERLNQTWQNTSTIISRGNWRELYKPITRRAQSSIFAGSTINILTIVGEGYFEGAYAQLTIGTVADSHKFEIWVDGAKYYGGKFESNGALVGMAAKELLQVDSSNWLSVPLGNSMSVSSNITSITGIIGPNNDSNTSGPFILLSQPIFYKTDLTLKVVNNQATADTVNWMYLGGEK